MCTLGEMLSKLGRNPLRLYTATVNILAKSAPGGRGGGGEIRVLPSFFKNREEISFGPPKFLTSLGDFADFWGISGNFRHFLTSKS